MLLNVAGEYCERFDYCHSNPCQNEGICSSQENGHSCACVDGWTGDTCATDVNECRRNSEICQVRVIFFGC